MGLHGTSLCQGLVAYIELHTKTQILLMIFHVGKPKFKNIDQSKKLNEDSTLIIHLTALFLSQYVKINSFRLSQHEKLDHSKNIQMDL